MTSPSSVFRSIHNKVTPRRAAPGCTGALLIVTAFLPCAATQAAPPLKRPNVLFLLTDDQRGDTIAALGNPNIQTPNLDRLVHSGLVFRNGYCMGGYSGAVCLPSRQMVQTGRAWFAVRDLPQDAPNFPRSMNEAGYLTWHYGKRGNTPVDIQANYTHSQYLTDNDDRMSGYPLKTIAEAAVGFIRDRATATDGKPFFMYLAPANPHDPRVAASEYLARYDAARLPLPPNFLPLHPFNNGDLGVRDERLAPWPRPEDNIRSQIRDYYAVITAMDERFGRILDALSATGQYQNTIIIFSSDQGIALGSHGLMGKQNLYEPSMNPHIIFSGPGIPRGKSTDAFAYLLDIYPTVLDLVGAKMPDSLDGKSLAPIIRGEAQLVRDTIFLGYRDVQRAVRQGPWKLIRYPQVDKTLLFNLDDDPAETRDLAGDPAQAERIEHLMAVMAREQKLFGDTQPLVVENRQPAAVDLKFYEGLAKQPLNPAKKGKGKKQRQP